MKNKKFKILSIDHVAVATTDLSIFNSLFIDLLGMNSMPVECIEDEKVKVKKIYAEDKKTAIELLESTNESSVVQKFIKTKGQGLHHIALSVDSIGEAIIFLKQKNIQLVYDVPKKGSDNKIITFIHPKFSPGLLIELCQKL